MSAFDPFPAAALAAASLPSTGSGRVPPPARPDPAEQLLAAVRARDGQLVSRLLQQWVHRRGLASLEPFRRRLAVAEGQPACDWLEALLEQPMVPVPAAAAVSQPLAPAAIAAAGSAFAWPEPGDSRSADAPAAAVTAVAPAVVSAPPAADRITEELDQALSAYWQATDPTAPVDRPSEFAAPPSPPQEAAAAVEAAGDAVADAAIPDGETDVSSPDGTADAGVALGLAGRVVAAGRQSFTGLRSLVRDCLDEALGGFSPAGTAVRPRPTGAAAARTITATAAGPAAGRDLRSGVTGLPAEQSLAAGAESPVVTEAPLAPAVPRSGAGRDEPAPSALPAPYPWQSRPVATPSRSPAPRGDRPAPAPADLSDLRAWLPDSTDPGSAAF